MFYLKSNNIEDVFRKAAENYRLDADKASDWDSIHAALHDGNKPPDGENEKKKRRFIFWWLLLLLPAAWLAQYIWQNNSSRNKSKPPKEAVVPATQENGFEKEAVKIDNQQEPAPVTMNREQANGDKAGETAPETGTVPAGKDVSRNYPVKKKAGNTAVPGGGFNTPSSQKKQSRSRVEKWQYTAINKEGITVKQKQRTVQEKNNFSGYEAGAINNKPGQQGDRSILRDKAGRFTDVAEKIAFTAKKDLSPGTGGKAVAIDSNALQKKPIITGAGKRSFFYAGLLAAPDLSFVKSQRINNVGYGLGLLAGFQINNRFSIESGAILEKKYYYSAGDYFDKSSVPYLNQVDLQWVKGNCNMMEVPLNLKYTFHAGKQGNWFATGGMSSYFMTKEYYDYNYKYNGTAYTRGYGYKRAEKDWFSVINLSAGYEQGLSKTIHLRIEPYLKLPVAGVGIGSLSLNSAGAYIGITRRF